MVTELLLKAAANSLTGLRSGESGKVGCVMTAGCCCAELLDEMDREWLPPVMVRECWVAAAGETGVCEASRACRGWEVPLREMMVAAEAAVGSCGGGEGIECSLAVFSHPQGQLVIREAAGLLYCGVAAAGFT